MDIRADDSKGKLNTELQTWGLYRGQSKRPIVEVVPDSASDLYRIAWPDIGLSDRANLTRCKQAAREWAEQRFLTEQRNLPVARRLKSLNSFRWSASPVAWRPIL